MQNKTAKYQDVCDKKQLIFGLTPLLLSKHIALSILFVYLCGLNTLSKHLPYVHSKFIWQEAVVIYYIPWPAKKLLPKILTQVSLPETAKNCGACTAN